MKGKNHIHIDFIHNNSICILIWKYRIYKLYLPASRIGWLSLYQTISVLGFESSAVQASSIKFPAITGVGCLSLTLLGGTKNRIGRYYKIEW